MNFILLLLFATIEGISKDSSCDELMHFFDELNPGSALNGMSAVSAPNRDGVEEGGHFEALNEYLRCAALKASSNRVAPQWDGFQEPQTHMFTKIEAKSFFKERNVPVVESFYEGLFDESAHKVLVRLIRQGIDFVIKPSGDGRGIGVLLFKTVVGGYAIENLAVEGRHGQEFPNLTRKQLLAANDQQQPELADDELNPVIKIKAENLTPELQLRKDQGWFRYMKSVLTKSSNQILIEELISTDSEVEIRKKPRSVPLEIKLSVIWGKVISVSSRPLDDPAFVWRRDGFLYTQPQKFAVGKKARIVALKKRGDLNGKVGTIKQLFAKPGRHKVELEDDVIAVKPQNLIVEDNLWEKVNSRVGAQWNDIFAAAENVASSYKYRMVRVDVFVPSNEKWFINEVEFPDFRFSQWMPHGMPDTAKFQGLAMEYYSKFNNYFLSCSLNSKDGNYLGFIQDGKRKFKISKGQKEVYGNGYQKVVPKKCDFVSKFYESNALKNGISYERISAQDFFQNLQKYVYC